MDVAILLGARVPVDVTATGDINGVAAAKRSCSSDRQSAGRPPHLPHRAWRGTFSRVNSPCSPSCSQQRTAAEFLYATRAQHRDKVQIHRWGPWILATDGGVGIPTSAGIGILLSSLRSSEIIEKVSANGGARPCSRTTESRALLPAMERPSVHRIQHRQKTCLWLQTVIPF
ncbi:hypothetical protein TcBrA4_0121260 [Trypanosoma cruzi]|nr:hypothetical protein TcBrA4_0121260 [Trypanosoma cruzi]